MPFREVGTLAPHLQPEFGVSGRVAKPTLTAGQYAIALSDSFFNGVTQTKIARSPASPRGIVFLKLEHANETCGEPIGRTAL
jgi:hypothetical protein